MRSVHHAPDEAAMRALGAHYAHVFGAGDAVRLVGELGAGKTTFVRGLLEGLGHLGAVRSPTFNLVQTFDTTPPVMHADLYRVKDPRGIGLEDYLETHLCLIEWPDRADSLIAPTDAWTLTFHFDGEGRRVEVTPPQTS